MRVNCVKYVINNAIIICLVEYNSLLYMPHQGHKLCNRVVVYH